MTEGSLLPPGWQVPQVFRDRLGASVGRQRPMRADGHLLLVLHAPPRPDDTARVGRFFWRDTAGHWASNEFGAGLGAMSRHLDEFDARITALDRREEAAKTADEYFAILEELTPLHRAARNMHQVLQTARTQNPEIRELIDFRDRAYSIERTAELLYGGTRNALDLMVARQAEQQSLASQGMAVAAYRLNLLAALFFPVVTLSAILSIDVVTVAAVFGVEGEGGGMPAAAVYALLLLVGLTLGGLLTAVVLRTGSAGTRAVETRKSDATDRHRS